MEKIKGTVDVPGVGAVEVATLHDGVTTSEGYRHRVEVAYQGQRMTTRAWGTAPGLLPEHALGVIAADAGADAHEIAAVTGDDKTAAALWSREIASARRVFRDRFGELVAWGTAWS